MQNPSSMREQMRCSANGEAYYAIKATKSEALFCAVVFLFAGVSAVRQLVACPELDDDYATLSLSLSLEAGVCRHYVVAVECVT